MNCFPVAPITAEPFGTKQPLAPEAEQSRLGAGRLSCFEQKLQILPKQKI
jgi:hypothetical protein